MDELPFRSPEAFTWADADPRWMVADTGHTLHLRGSPGGQHPEGGFHRYLSEEGQSRWVPLPRGRRLRLTETSWWFRAGERKAHVIGYDPAGIEPEEGRFSIRPAGSRGWRGGGGVRRAGLGYHHPPRHDGRTVSVLHSGLRPPGFTPSGRPGFRREPTRSGQGGLAGRLQADRAEVPRVAGEEAFTGSGASPPARRALPPRLGTREWKREGRAGSGRL